MSGTHQSPTDLLGDICDGELFKHHPVFLWNEAIQIIAYYDDLTLTNPIGSSAKNHRIGKQYT